MAELTVSELKKRFSEIMRTVEDDHACYVITWYGRSVAMLTPYDSAPVMIGEPSAWDKVAELGKQLAQEWTADQNSAQILSEMR